MKANHTPGPWEGHRHKEQDNKKAGFIVIQSRYRNTANVATVIPCIGMKPEEVESNARLIAAAPDMLSMLQMLNDYADAFGEPQLMKAKISALIKKATCDE